MQSFTVDTNQSNTNPSGDSFLPPFSLDVNSSGSGQFCAVLKVVIPNVKNNANGQSTISFYIDPAPVNRTTASAVVTATTSPQPASLIEGVTLNAGTTYTVGVQTDSTQGAMFFAGSEDMCISNQTTDQVTQVTSLNGLTVGSNFIVLDGTAAACTATAVRGTPNCQTPSLRCCVLDISTGWTGSGSSFTSPTLIYRVAPNTTADLTFGCFVGSVPGGDPAPQVTLKVNQNDGTCNTVRNTVGLPAGVRSSVALQYPVDTATTQVASENQAVLIEVTAEANFDPSTISGQSAWLFVAPASIT